jgi:hypothetical protein
VTDLLDRLRSALADRYRIQRELGAGGMATVYLAFPCAEARARPNDGERRLRATPLRPLRPLPHRT